jgi:hypothetical protein
MQVQNSEFIFDSRRPYSGFLGHLRGAANLGRIVEFCTETSAKVAF